MEKWMQSKGGNPYARPIARRPVRARTRTRANRPAYSKRANRSAYSKKIAAHYGMPIQMFKDSDKDGVMNGFDCQAHNKRKQDVRRPMNVGRGGISSMYARKEQDRFTKDYMNRLNEIQRQEYERLSELKRIQTPTTIINRSSDTTPVILVDGKWVSITSAAGKAQIKKDEAQYNTAINPPIGSNNSGYDAGKLTYSGNVPDPRHSPQSSGSGGGTSYTPQSSGSGGGTATATRIAPVKVSAPRPEQYSAPPPPKKSVFQRVRSWFRR